MSSGNVLWVIVEFVLHTRGMRDECRENGFKHKEHFPLWAATSDPLHSVRRSHLKTKCCLFLLGHHFPLGSGAADSTVGVKVHITALLFSPNKHRLKWTKTLEISVTFHLKIITTFACCQSVVLWLQKLAGISLLSQHSVLHLLIMQRDGETLIFYLNAFALTVWWALPLLSQSGRCHCVQTKRNCLCS